jgi:hypothetical protein
VKARPSFEKRRKEMQRQERNKEKEERRKQRKDKPKTGTEGDPDTDPTVGTEQPLVQEPGAAAGPAPLNSSGASTP